MPDLVRSSLFDCLAGKINKFCSVTGLPNLVIVRLLTFQHDIVIFIIILSFL